MKMLKKAMNNERTAGIIFTMPFTIGFLLIMIVPMGISLYYSFCSYDILSPPVFTGLQNFKTMFADETFYKSIKVTFFFASFICADRGDAAAQEHEDDRILPRGLLPAIHHRRLRCGRYPVEAYVCHGRRDQQAASGSRHQLHHVLAGQYEDGDLGADYPGSVAVRFFHADLFVLVKADSAVVIRGGQCGRRERHLQILPDYTAASDTDDLL